MSNLNTTELPSELTVAATFNPEAAREAGRVIGSEVSDYGLDVLLAPGINLLRNTLGGRNGEYYSEDPVHAGKIAAAFVNGIQEQGVGVALNASYREADNAWELANGKYQIMVCKDAASKPLATKTVRF